jgi:TonB family protein
MSQQTEHVKARRFEVPTSYGSWFGFFLLGLLLNLPLPWLFQQLLSEKKTVKRQVIRIQSVRMTRKQRRLARQRRRQLAKLKKPKKRKVDPNKLKGQVVDLAPTKDNRPPPKARFLSAYNTRTKKQSISRFRRLKYKVAMNTPTQKKRSIVKKARRSKRTLIVKSKRSRKQKPAKKIRRGKQIKLPGFRVKTKNKRLRIPKLARKNKKSRLQKAKKGVLRYRKRFKIAMNFKGPHKKLRLSVGDLQLPGRRSKTKKGTNGGRRMPDIYDLRPSFGKASRVVGAPAPDLVKNVKVGDQTLLNSRRFIYATFFNRIKQIVAQHWSPARVYRRRDPYGNVYGSADRYTLLSVVLDKKGKLTDVTVKKTSGLRFLDKEAVRAFRAARHFPNPPTALIGSDGKIRFRFGFMLELSSRPGFLLFR